MSFFEDKRGRFYPVANIDRIVPSRHQPGRDEPTPARIYLVNGDEAGVEVWDVEVDAIKRGSYPTFAAQPGFSVLGYYFSRDNSEPAWVDEHPVIGWRLGEYGTQPITLDDMYNGELRETHAILRPDGRIYSPGMEADYQDRQAWLNDMEKHAEEMRAVKPSPPEGSVAPAPSPQT